MDVLSVVWTIIKFIILISFLVVIHEGGNFLTAKAFGMKVKSGLQKHGKNIAKGAVIGLGLVAAYAIGSRTGGSDDDSDVVADSDYVEIDETESTDETSEN